MRWPAPLVLMSTLSLVVGEARAIEPAGGEPADAEVLEVIDIAVDVADLPESRSNIAVVVEREMQRLLSERTDLPAGVALEEDRRLWVELRPGPIPGSDDVLIRVEAQLDAKLLAESLTESCLSCSDEQVAQKAVSMSRPLLEKFPAIERRSAPLSPSATTRPDADETDRPRRADPRLISGAATLGLGLVRAGVGVGLIAADERVLSEPGAARLDIVKYRDPGIAVAVAGGALAITGAALLGVALARRGGRGHVAATPMLAPDLHGIGVVGRF